MSASFSTPRFGGVNGMTCGVKFFPQQAFELGLAIQFLQQRTIRTDQFECLSSSRSSLIRPYRLTISSISFGRLRGDGELGKLLQDFDHFRAVSPAAAGVPERKIRNPVRMNMFRTFLEFSEGREGIARCGISGGLSTSTRSAVRLYDQRVARIEGGGRRRVPKSGMAPEGHVTRILGMFRPRRAEQGKFSGAERMEQGRTRKLHHVRTTTRDRGPKR